MENPNFDIEPIFPYDHLHNHSSCIIETADNVLTACWYRGTGERTADDVCIMGSHRTPAGQWTTPEIQANTPGFPDTNPILMQDNERRQWLFYGTQLDNHWESTLLKYQRIDSSLRNITTGILHLKPDDDAFIEAVDRLLPEAYRTALAESVESASKTTEYIERQKERAQHKLSRRLGWMARCHALIEGSNIFLPLYSDGFDFSLIALSDDSGETWRCSLPLVGPGAIQPTLLRRHNGVLVAYCRNNGPEPKKILVSESLDDGFSWSVAQPCSLPNYGSSVEGIVLQDGRWLLCYNDDLGTNRCSLVIALSEDEGETWGEPLFVERVPETEGSFHYPSVIQAQNSDIHITYTCTRGGPAIPKDDQGRSLWETIKHARISGTLL